MSEEFNTPRSDRTKCPASRVVQHVYWWLAGLVVLAAVVRGAGFPRMGIEHFDEGVYAVSGLWPFAPEEAAPFYVAQHFYAPWLLPFLIGLSYLALGVTDLAAILVSLVAGSLTVVAVWWVGNRWYGPRAGLAAACLAALSDVHIFYSRMVLTDVLLTLWVVLASGLLVEAFARNNLKWAIAAGVVTALAWNTKYNGWLPLAWGLIPVAAAPFYACERASRRERFRQRAVCWAVAATVAAVGYFPWLLYVQSQPGGYAAVVAHHQNFLMGWPTWWTNLQAHAAMQGEMEGVASRLALLAAFAAAALANWSGWKWSTWRLGVVAAGTFATAWQGGATVVLVVSTMVFFVLEMRRASDQTLMHLGWFGLLVLLTPLYYLYARLALPFFPVLWLGTGAFFASRLIPLLEEERGQLTRTASSLEHRCVAWLLLAGSLAAIVWLVVDPASLPKSVIGRSTDDVRRAVDSIKKRIPENAKLLVYAEPPVVFYLGGRGILLRNLETLEAGRLANQSTLKYLVVGPHARLDPWGRDFLERERGKSLRLLESYPLDPSLAVRLDLRGPSRVDIAAEAELWRLELYELP